MDKIRLGNSDIFVSRMTLGCWTFGSSDGSYWGAQEQSESEAVLRRALEMGVNFLDTAYAYNDGEAEKALGKAIHGLRDKVIVCDKIPVLTWDTLPTHGQKVRECLERLQTEYIDVLLLHWPCNDRDLLKANLEQLQKVQEQGLVRTIGVSNFGVGQMEVAREMGLNVCVNELAYNAMHRSAELAVLPYVSKHNIGVMAYMPLMQGILSGKYNSIEEIPAIRRRTIHFDSRNNPNIRHGGAGMEAELGEFMGKLAALSQESGIACSNLCLGWLMHNSSISTALVGCRTCKQLEENVHAVETELSDELYRRMNEISAPLAAKCGANCDMWQWNSRVW